MDTQVSVQLVRVCLRVGDHDEDGVRGVRIVRIMPAFGGGFVVPDEEIERGDDLAASILSVEGPTVVGGVEVADCVGGAPPVFLDTD